MSVAEIKEKIAPILHEYGVKKASLFGSMARGDARADSDVDLLIEFGTRPMGIYDSMQMKERLESILHARVDVVSEGYVNKFLEPYIRAELQTVYED